MSDIEYESSIFSESDSECDTYSFSEEEYEFDEEDVTIESFGPAVSKVFHSSHKSISAVYSEMPARDIIELEKSTIAMLEKIPKIKDAKDVSMVMACSALLKELQGSYALRMFTAADDENLFTQFYPEHAIYYQQYFVSQYNVATTFQATIPHLELRFNGMIAIGLGQTIAAFVQLAGVDEDNWNMDDFLSMVDQREDESRKKERILRHKNATESATGTINLISVPAKDKAYKISTLGIRASETEGSGRGTQKQQTFTISFLGLQENKMTNSATGTIQLTSVPSDDKAYGISTLGIRVPDHINSPQEMAEAEDQGNDTKEQQSLTIRFTGLQNKKDKNNEFFIHRKYGHPNESVTRHICERENVSFTATDGEAIRNCEVYLYDKGRAVSQNETATDRATQRLYRLHMDSIEFGQGKYLTVITDEYSSYVWANYSTNKGELREQTEVTLRQINELFADRKISFVTEENGIELPQIKFLESLGIRQDQISSYRPQLNGRAERHNGIIVSKVKSILREATSNDFIQKLLQQEAIYHAVSNHNLTPNSRGQVPKELLMGTEVSRSIRRPIFGGEVIVKLAASQGTSERKLEDDSIRGYVGTIPGNSAVHRIWTNFDKPTEKLKIVRACNFSFNLEFTNMRTAEREIEKVAEVVKSQEELDAPIPPQFPNVVIAIPSANTSRERRFMRKVRPKDDSHETVATYLSPEARTEMEDRVKEHESLKSRLSELESQFESNGNRISGLETDQQLQLRRMKDLEKRRDDTAYSLEGIKLYQQSMRESLTRFTANAKLSIQDMRKEVDEMQDKFKNHMLEYDASDRDYDSQRRTQAEFEQAISRVKEFSERKKPELEVFRSKYERDETDGKLEIKKKIDDSSKSATAEIHKAEEHIGEKQKDLIGDYDKRLCNKFESITGKIDQIHVSQRSAAELATRVDQRLAEQDIKHSSLDRRITEQAIHQSDQTNQVASQTDTRFNDMISQITAFAGETRNAIQESRADAQQIRQDGQRLVQCANNAYNRIIDEQTRLRENLESLSPYAVHLEEIENAITQYTPESIAIAQIEEEIGLTEASYNENRQMLLDTARNMETIGAPEIHTEKIDATDITRGIVTGRNGYNFAGNIPSSGVFGVNDGTSYSMVHVDTDRGRTLRSGRTYNPPTQDPTTERVNAISYYVRALSRAGLPVKI